MNKTLMALAALLVASSGAQAVVNLSSATGTYSQDFDTLASSGNSNAWTLSDWAISRSIGSFSTYAAGTGSSNTGALYSFGSSGSSERALGSVASGTPGAWTYALGLSNASGVAFDSFTLQFTGEQWRNSGNTNSQSLVFSYGFGATQATAAWVTPGAGFDFVSPTTGGTAVALDGNAAGNRVALGGAVGTTWASGQTLWLRWVDIDNSGADHGLAIDDLRFSVTSAVPEPGSYALMLAGLAAIGALARRRGTR